MKLSFALLGCALGASVSLISQISAEAMRHLAEDPSITHRVTFEVVQTKGDTETVMLGRLDIALFGTVVPKTVRNFVELSRGTYGFGYEGSGFHRVIANFMVQGGDFQNGDGTGGHSIYNDHGKFDDENFELHHSKRGRLLMANAGPNTNGAQFFITNTEDCNYLNGKHVVFGQLIDGFDVLDAIAHAPTAADRPVQPITITRATVWDLGKVHDQYDAPQVVRDTGMPFYKLLLLLLLVFSLGWACRDFYFKRQLVHDRREASLYN